MDRAICFKTKPYPVIQADGSKRMAVNMKKTVGRSDCTLKPHEHAYYNSDLFNGMLRHAYQKVIGEYTNWCYLDTLPAGVTVDTGGFLAVVTVELPATFR